MTSNRDTLYAIFCEKMTQFNSWYFFINYQKSKSKQYAYLWYMYTWLATHQLHFLKTVGVIRTLGLPFRIYMNIGVFKLYEILIQQYTFNYYIYFSLLETACKLSFWKTSCVTYRQMTSYLEVQWDRLLVYFSVWMV